MPWPWSAERGNGSPRPRRWNSAESGVLPRIVDLVREHEHGLPGRSQRPGQILVARRDAGACVDDEQDEIGFLDRGARLPGDLRTEDVRRLVVDPARVDQEEVDTVPLAEQLLAVARDAGRLVHDGRPRLGQAVDQGRLADVREADDGDGAGDAVRRLGGVVHAGGIAWRGRPLACTSTSQARSSRSLAAISAEASR